MPNRLLTPVVLGILALTGTSTTALAGEDLLRLIGFGGVCADCDLSGKDLSGVSMNGASFPRANFTNANLTEAKISGANFGRAVFKRADFSDALLEGSNFARSDLTGAKMDDIKARGINLAYAILNGIQGEDAEIVGSNLSHASMVGAKLPDAVFDNSNLSYADLSGVKLPDASLLNVKLFKARLDGALLSGAEFEGADLSKVEFGHADVRNTGFDRTVLKGANLSKVKHLKQEQLDDACGDSKTLLPDGLKVQMCEGTQWAKIKKSKNGNTYTYSFSIDLSDDERKAIAKATKEAMKESGFAIQKARIALAEAIGQGDFPTLVIERDGQSYTWPKLDNYQSEEQRSIGRALRVLDGVKLQNRRAQRALDVAVRSLEKAQNALQQDYERQELAGGTEN